MHEGKRGNRIRQDYLCCDSFVEYLLLFGDFVHSAASSPLPGSPCSALPHSNPCVCAGHNKSVWRFCWFTVCLCWSGPEEGLCWRQFPTTHQLCCVVRHPRGVQLQTGPIPKLWSNRFPWHWGPSPPFQPACEEEEGQLLMPRSASTELAPAKPQPNFSIICCYELLMSATGVCSHC